MEKKISKIQAMLTAVGIMIGCGIYFKTDNILSSVNGNFFMAMFIWLIICIGFIISGFAAGAIAQHLDPNGGMVGYFEQIFGRKFAFIVGWFEFSIYSPIMVTVVGNVICQYFLMLFNLEHHYLLQFILNIFVVFATLFWNYLSTKLATLISVTSTYLKVIPLIVFCIIGFIYGNPQHLTPEYVVTQTNGVFAFLAPFITIAFMFDGWINVGSLAVDMKNPKKDLPFVYTTSIIMTCCIYLMYFVGINLLMNSSEIMNLGDNHLYNIAQQFIGQYGANIIIIFVIISGIGTLNAMFMSGNRYIEKLADDNLMFCSNFFKKRSKFDTPFNASLLSAGIACVMALFIYLQNIHFSVSGVEIFNGILLEDAAVAFNSLFTGTVFLINFYLYKQKKLNFFFGIVCPIIAVALHLTIFISYVLTSNNLISSLISIVIIIGVMVLGLIVNKEELFPKKS